VPQSPYKKLSDKIIQNETNSIGIFKLHFNICNNSYVGQTGGSSEIRHKEHTRYIITNNPVSFYAPNILNNKHKYGNIEQTIELLKPCNKEFKMKIWESLFIHILQIQNLLIEEQKVNDPNPPYELAQDVALHNLSLHAFCVPSRFFY